MIRQAMTAGLRVAGTKPEKAAPQRRGRKSTSPWVLRMSGSCACRGSSAIGRCSDWFKEDGSGIRSQEEACSPRFNGSPSDEEAGP